MALFSSAKNVFCEVNFPSEKEEATLAENATSLAMLGHYAIMIHDKDVKEDGEVKTHHAHVYICANDARGTKGWIDALSLAFRLPPNYIRVEPTNNPTGAIRYLRHLDDKDKYQYPAEGVITNDLEMCKKAWEAVPKRSLASFSKEDLLGCQDLEDLLDLVGNNFYSKIKPIWLDLTHTRMKRDRIAKDFEDMAKRHADAVKEIADIIDHEQLDPRLRMRLAEVQRILTLGKEWAVEKFEEENGIDHQKEAE